MDFDLTNYNTQELLNILEINKGGNYSLENIFNSTKTTMDSTRLSDDNANKSREDENICTIEELEDAMNELENINAYLYSIEALMERIFDIKVSNKIETKFKEIAGELAPDPLNIDRLILNRLFHETPDCPDKKN